MNCATDISSVSLSLNKSFEEVHFSLVLILIVAISVAMHPLVVLLRRSGALYFFVTTGLVIIRLSTKEGSPCAAIISDNKS